MAKQRSKVTEIKSLNNVAQFAYVNRAATFRDRKNDYKRNKKHKNPPCADSFIYII
mgnify:CR=1 FL=1